MIEKCDKKLQNHDRGLYRPEPTLTASACPVDIHSHPGDRPMVSFTSYDYLGLEVTKLNKYKSFLIYRSRSFIILLQK